MTAAYLHSKNVSHHGRANLFPIPLAEKLEQSATSLLTWHSTIKRVLKQAIKEHKKQQEASHQPLSKYFADIARLKSKPPPHRKKRTASRMATKPSSSPKNKSDNLHKIHRITRSQSRRKLRTATKIQFARRPSLPKPNHHTHPVHPT